MEHIKKILDAEIYHLYITYPEFIRRINNIQSRGVIMEPGYNYRMLYDERIELYNKYADYTFNVDPLDFN
tara:strand:- start:1026 stop:1235 length:210 start_codon:yes stop_codon:yes gene_type:complete